MRHPMQIRCRSRRLRLGLSMVEAMISLAITASLLVATGSAFTASASAVKNNNDFFRASNTARVTMNQMLVEIRRCDSVQCPVAGGTYVDVIRPAETLTTNEVFRRYSFDSANKKLNLQIYYTGNLTSPLYTLASNVTAASFGPPQMGTDANNTTVVQRLPITLTVKVGSNQIVLSGAAGSRRALKAF